MVISWHEHVPDDERPPKNIWHNDRAIERHFSKIRKQRERKYSGDESEDGTLEDARMGRDVTLTNALVDQIMSADTSADDDYSEI